VTAALILLCLITPFAYIVSPYIFLVVLMCEAFLFVHKISGTGNRFFILLLLGVMFSCISVAGIRLYDLVIVVAFIVTWVKKRGHILVTPNVVPFFALAILVGITHGGSENLTETLRYIICILLFITAFNNEYNFGDVQNYLIGITLANIYYAVAVFGLNTLGRIRDYNGIVSSNIYVISSSSEVRLNGFFSDPNKYMAFCLAVLFIVELWIQKGKFKNLLILILCISSLISLSRTAILSLLAYLFFKVIKVVYEKSKVLSVALGSAIIIAIILLIVNPDVFSAGVNYLYVTSTRLMGREHTLSINANLLSDNRTLIWRQAIGLIGEHPILGHGWNSIRKLLPYPTHNTVLELLLDSGIVGLVCYLILMRKLFFNKYYEYTIPFIWVPILLLDMGGYRVLFLLLGLVYQKNKIQDN
jgi:O-antigen ligase